mmetsp:Transcript_105564/g.281144  ORF Transcript_105564/g.281144 Transcript_105564/m.281144 type:complete len:217 (+) Transcript_105564:760-1410(+)
MASLARPRCMRRGSVGHSSRWTACCRSGPSGASARSPAKAVSRLATERLSQTRSTEEGSARTASTRCRCATFLRATTPRRIAPTQTGRLGQVAVPTTSATASARSRSLPLARARRARATWRRHSHASPPRRWTAWSPSGPHGTVATSPAGAARRRGSARSWFSLRVGVRHALVSCCRRRAATRTSATCRIARSATGRSGPRVLPPVARRIGRGSAR